MLALSAQIIGFTMKVVMPSKKYIHIIDVKNKLFLTETRFSV